MLINEIDVGKHAVIDCITDNKLWCRSHGLTSQTLSGLAVDNNWRRSAKLIKTFTCRAIHCGLQKLFATSASSLIDTWCLKRKPVPSRRRVLSSSAHLSWQIKQFTDDLSLQQLVQAFTTTRLDYCNGLRANCSMAVRKRMQRIQDSAARLVRSEAACSHATPLLHRLHCQYSGYRFTISYYRLMYKLCVLMFDVNYTRRPTCVVAATITVSASKTSSIIHPVKTILNFILKVNLYDQL